MLFDRKNFSVLEIKKKARTIFFVTIHKLKSFKFALFYLLFDHGMIIIISHAVVMCKKFLFNIFCQKLANLVNILLAF